MVIDKKDGSAERMIVTGMLVSTPVVARLAPKWDEEALSSTWANIVGTWAVEYYQKYNKAPGRNIIGIFESWAEDADDKDVVKTVERYLSRLSENYAKEKKDLNPDYVIDVAGKYLNKVRLERLAEQLQGDVDTNRVDEGFKRLEKFGGRAEVADSEGIDLFQNEAVIKAALSRKRDPIIEYPGALGRFFGGALERDGFISVMAPEKTGKTFWLLDIAWRAMLQRRRVAFFEIGDLSRDQIIDRFMARAAGRPVRATRPDRPLQYPKAFDCDLSELKFEVTKELRHYKKPLSSKLAWAACQKVMNDKVKSKRSFFKLVVTPNDSITVGGIESQVQTWVNKDWRPDVVIVDYADLIAAPPGYSESRDAVNHNWKRLRAISQKYHCLVVTATQTKATGYTAETLDMSHFSEDKRKFAHCTGMFGLSKGSEAHQKAGVMLLNWVVLREDEFHATRHAYVVPCLGIANPCVRSHY